MLTLRRSTDFIAAGYPEGNDWGVSHTAVLVVGNIPDGEDMCEILDNLQTEAYHDHHGWPNLYNFETVDGDYFGAYPGVDKHGKFNLFGDDSTYLWSMNSDVDGNEPIVWQGRQDFGSSALSRLT